VAAPWQEEALGAFGSGAQVPMDTWIPVDTRTGGWQLPGVPPASIGANISSVPASAGQPDQAPLSLGQVAGGFAPPMSPSRSMQRTQRLDQMGGLTPQPSVWEHIARGVGMASPQGRAILQGYDTQQQQQLQHQLTMRRQALQEAQQERTEIRDDFSTLMQLSNIKSKALRNLYTDRWVADMQAKGKALPADFIETFKKTGLDEGKHMAALMQPLIEQSGMDPTLVMQYLEEGRDPKEIMQLMEVAEKQKKTRLEQQESAELTTGLATLGGASGGTAPAPAPGTPGTTTTPQPPTARPPVATPPPQYTTAIDAAHSAYPTVRKELIPAIIAGESNWDEQAVSPKGAQGLMQLMPAAQKEMRVTDPFDAMQNVRGGTGYFAKMLERYKGNEALALAAYNWGPGNVDKVGGDLSKMPQETQDYVKTTLQRASAGGGTAPTPAQQPDTRMQVAGPGAPAPPPPAPTGGTAQEQAQLTDLTTRITAMDQFITANAGKGSDRAKATVAAIERQRDNLAKERDKLETRLGKEQERLEEPGKIRQRQEIEQPYKIAQQEAGARITLEAKANEPIGVDNGRKMNLPPSTRWKDVPKDVKVYEDPSPAEREKFSNFKASHAGIGRVLAMLEQPGAQKIVGTLFSEPEASFKRRMGEWISSVTPEQRKFVASLAAEISQIRHQLSGAAVSPQEFEALKPMFPDPGDPDVATVRAKLEALQEWTVRKHDAYRDQLDQVGIRTPKAMERPAAPPPLDPKAQQALDILKPKGK
jgi:hypothetical protein